MPRGSPFTALCQQVARLGRGVVADLHVHTTASDGDFTPSQIVAFARRAKLDAVAITDHDTMASVGPATAAAAGSSLQVIPGVELSTSVEGREVHLLGLFLDPAEPILREKLAEVCIRRRDRFRAYIAALGISFPDGLVAGIEAGTVALGRRHVAGLLVRTGHASSRYDAFQRLLLPLAEQVPATHLTPFDEACILIREAGGIPSLAHPPTDTAEVTLEMYREMGMLGIEVNYPATTVGFTETLRGYAANLGLVVTGGSDCHGPDRELGSRGISEDEFLKLKALIGRG